MLFTVKRGIEIDGPRSDAMRPLHGSLWRKLSRIRPAPDVLSICAPGRTGVWLYGAAPMGRQLQSFLLNGSDRFDTILCVSTRMPSKVAPQAATEARMGRFW